jgi:transcriptional regulator with XRE-family HTH domain
MRVILYVYSKYRADVYNKLTMKKLFTILGKNIKSERNKKGLTQEKLAERVGVSNNFISYIESGKKVASIKTVNKIAEVLDIPIADLFKDIPGEKRSKKDYTADQILFLIKDKSPSTKKLLLELCQTVVKEKK